MSDKYDWKFGRVGGVTRVNIETGEDYTHLDELDQKMWTVLSCPTTGLEFDSTTLKMLDTDADGRIRVAEVKAASAWLRDVLSDREVIVQAPQALPLSAINDQSEQGRKILESARRILSNLGKPEAEAISIADTNNCEEIFSKTRFNGDGIITEAATDDEALKTTIKNIKSAIGTSVDRSGEPGIGQSQVDAFYQACEAYKAWLDSATPETAPYGDHTAQAYAAVEAVRAKVEDYFVRCKLAAFDSDIAGALDVSVERIGSISAQNLATSGEEIASYPLARVRTECTLPLDAINPSWQAAISNMSALVLDPDATSMTEEQWRAVLSKLAPYAAWLGSKAGAAVESLGVDTINASLDSAQKPAIEALIAEDLSYAHEATCMDTVRRLVYYARYFGQFVRNFVTFADFYSPGVKAIFQAGELYIDQRCCELCIKVNDTDSKGSIAALSGMYIAYCDCISKATGAKIQIAAVITEGEVNDIRVGKNCVFYDRSGMDWDAVITKIIDNPISVRQAFMSPYRKLARTINDRITKSANSMSAKVDAGLNSKAATATIPTSAAEVEAAKAAPKQNSFDIAKFAGIFAAIGMAVGYITAAIAKLITPWTNIIFVLLALVVIVSGPSMFLAWQKIRKRNISPVLNNNGWAMNATALVNAGFGATLTSIASFPFINIPDPFAPKKRHTGRKILLVLIVLCGAFAALYFTGCLKKVGLPYPRETATVQQSTPAVAPQSAPAATVKQPQSAAATPVEQTQPTDTCSN